MSVDIRELERWSSVDPCDAWCAAILDTTQSSDDTSALSPTRAFGQIPSMHRSVLAMLVVTISCSKTGQEQTAAKPFKDSDEAWVETKALWTKIQGAVDASGGDCEKFGTALSPLLPATRSFVARGKLFDAVPEQRSEFEAKYGREMGDLLFPSKKLFFKCKKTPAVASMITALRE